MAKMNWDRDRRNRAAQGWSLDNPPVAGGGGRSIASSESYLRAKSRVKARGKADLEERREYIRRVGASLDQAKGLLARLRAAGRRR